ncbi:hypothetical protein GF336_07430 [Candidatus Woesearchaeota archaeon]|nr:hypothetical protein [Candidatus Woesearchaeota archaeon]
MKKLIIYLIGILIFSFVVCACSTDDDCATCKICGEEGWCVFSADDPRCTSGSCGNQCVWVADPNNPGHIISHCGCITDCDCYEGCICSNFECVDGSDVDFCTPETVEEDCPDLPCHNKVCEGYDADDCELGHCAYEEDDTLTCDDGYYCTIGDNCEDGECVGEESIAQCFVDEHCSSDDACLDCICNEETDSCVETEKDCGGCCDCDEGTGLCTNPNPSNCPSCDEGCTPTCSGSGGLSSCSCGCDCPVPEFSKTGIVISLIVILSLGTYIIKRRKRKSSV